MQELFEWLQEVFEVVDEANTVIGRALRSEVHRLGLLHRAVHVLVFNSESELLLQQRSPKHVPVIHNLVCFSQQWSACFLSVCFVRMQEDHRAVAVGPELRGAPHAWRALSAGEPGCDWCLPYADRPIHTTRTRQASVAAFDSTTPAFCLCAISQPGVWAQAALRVIAEEASKFFPTAICR